MNAKPLEIKKYRRKPVIIEAVQLTSDNIFEVIEWINKNSGLDKCAELTLSGISIKTLEGTRRANLGDYIIKSVKGEFYPEKPDIFEETYELVKEKQNELQRDLDR